VAPPKTDRSGNTTGRGGGGEKRGKKEPMRVSKGKRLEKRARLSQNKGGGVLMLPSDMPKKNQASGAGILNERTGRRLVRLIREGRRDSLSH